MDLVPRPVAADVRIPRRFCGPPDRGNGGVTAGALAAFIDGPAEVTLRLPSPLEVAMKVVRDGEMFTLRDDDTTIAEARAATVDVEPPDPVSLADARAAAATSAVVVHPEWHPFPTCFVCGPDRVEGDGLRVHPGRVGDHELLAAPVVYPADLADADGRVPEQMLWAALDCPSSFVMYLGGERPVTPYVLGRIAAHIRRAPAIDAPLVAMSWPLGVDGRKLFAASALYDGDEPVAVARATWISVP
jgi:hypothetical protein